MASEKRKNIGLILAVLLACHLSPATGHRSWAASWEDEKDVWEQMSSTRFYKDPGYAAKLALNFLPVDNGHFYVGEVGKGIWFSVGQTASLVAVAAAYLGSQSRAKEDERPIWTSSMIASAAGGVVSYIGLKVWSAYSAAEGARRYNRAREAEEEKKKEQQGWRWGIHPEGVVVVKRWGPVGGH
jgi:hypothetical protein